MCGRRPACFCRDAKQHLETCARGETLTVGTETLVPEQVFGMLLERLAAFAETHRRNVLETKGGAEPVRDVVVALPASALASAAVQARVVDAARTVGLRVRALVSDAVAAAVCYVATHPAVADGARVVLVDVGECGVNAAAVAVRGGAAVRLVRHAPRRVGRGLVRGAVVARAEGAPVRLGRDARALGVRRALDAQQLRRVRVAQQHSDQRARHRVQARVHARRPRLRRAVPGALPRRAQQRAHTPHTPRRKCVSLTVMSFHSILEIPFERLVTSVSKSDDDGGFTHKHVFFWLAD